MTDQTPSPAPEPMGAEPNRPGVPAILAVAFVALFAAVFAAAYALKDGALVNSMADTLKSVVMIVVGFYFGSAVSSQKKDAIIASMAAGQGQ